MPFSFHSLIPVSTPLEHKNGMETFLYLYSAFKQEGIKDIKHTGRKAKFPVIGNTKKDQKISGNFKFFGISERIEISNFQILETPLCDFH